LEHNAAGNWDGVIAQIRRLHAVDDQYRAAEADRLLATALRQRGVVRIQSDEMEAGIFDLDQALAFGPLDAEATNYRAWARLYLAAKSYWGVNWAEAASILQQLYVLAPNFKDTTRLLYQATLNYAQQLALDGEACAAAEEYAFALTLFSNPAVTEALTTAQANCALTPTPAPETLPEDTPTPEP
jgi:tetratricopeptide (TPR) repeat protein